MSFPLAPWHLWGNKQDLTLAASVLGTPATTTQLIKINYARPDTWTFFFGAVIQQMTNPTNDYTLDIWFDLIIGVGRSQIQLPGFEHFQLTSSGGAGLTVPAFFYSSEVVSPNRLRSRSAPLTSSSPGVIDKFPAQDIQCVCRSLFLGAPTNSVMFEAHAYFSPRTHIRPEWFSEGEQFRGHEQGGT